MNAPLKPKAEFVWSDPLLLDQQLTQDERMVRDAAHDYCQGKLAVDFLSCLLFGRQVLESGECWPGILAQPP